MINYLDNGGNLYFESVNIGLDYQGSDFLTYLGVVYVDDGGDNEVAGIYGGQQSIASGMMLRYSGGTSPHYSVDRLSSLTSTALFNCESNFGRMYYHEGENYKVVASSVVVGALANGDSLNLKPYLMAEMVNDFMGFNPTVSLEELQEVNLQADASPNPFNDKLVISFYLEKSDPVQIRIFDQKGSLVKTLAEDRMLPGIHHISWDGSNNQGCQVGHGLFIYSIQTGEKIFNGKIIRMK